MNVKELVDQMQRGKISQADFIAALETAQKASQSQARIVAIEPAYGHAMIQIAGCCKPKSLSVKAAAALLDNADMARAAIKQAVHLADLAKK